VAPAAMAASITYVEVFGAACDTGHLRRGTPHPQLKRARRRHHLSAAIASTSLLALAQFCAPGGCRWCSIGVDAAAGRRGHRLAQALMSFSVAPCQARKITDPQTVRPTVAGRCACTAFEITGAGEGKPASIRRPGAWPAGGDRRLLLRLRLAPGGTVPHRGKGGVEDQEPGGIAGHAAIRSKRL